MQKKEEKPKMLCVRFPADLHHALKLKALGDGKPIQDYVIEVIKKALGK